MKDINKINSVIEAYFKNNPSITIVPAKELMPDFIKAGIFEKDNKNGKPIRSVLRALDRSNEMELIPFIHTERKDENIYWYFIPSNAAKPTTPYKKDLVSIKKEESIKSRLQSDESYIIDLCDTALNLIAERQMRFGFLLGDLHKDGVSRTKLPVDAYYKTLNLVIEYKEPQHTEENMPNVKTVSGVSRREQRKIYDERRAIKLPKNGIKLIEIAFNIFKCDSQNRIIRNSEEDLKKINEILKNENLT